MAYISKSALLFLACVISLLHAKEISAQESPKKFVAVIAVVSHYTVNLRSFDFREVGKEIEGSLRRLAKLQGYDDFEAIILDGTLDKPNEPTGSRIKSALQRISRPLRPQDTLVFHFLGHGATTGDDNFVLLSSGATSENDAAERVTSSDLGDIFSRSNAGTKLSFLDACQIYRQTGSSAQPAFTSRESMEKLLKRATGSAIVVAAELGAPSWVDDVKYGGGVRQIGVFTAVLLKLLGDLDGFAKAKKISEVTLQDVVVELIPRIDRWVRTSDLLSSTTAQKPRVFKAMQDDGKIVLATFATKDLTGRQILNGLQFPAQNEISTQDLKPSPLESGIDVFKARRNVLRGQRLYADDLVKSKALPASVASTDLPSDFSRDLQNSCAAQNIPAGEVITWKIVGGSNLCSR